MTKITFRTGSIDYKDRMLTDQRLEAAVFQLAYPENFRTDSETRACVLKGLANSATGVDIVSNSEIALNEVRLAVRRGDLKPDEVKILWYKEGKPGYETRREIKILQSGALEFYPNGFFDTLDSQLVEFFKQET